MSCRCQKPGAAFVLLLVLFCFPFPSLAVDDMSCHDRPWPWSSSDFTPDPDLRHGRLDNGLRYVILPNGEPRGRVGLYLDIQAGSLHERDDQRGLAHYLEHMLFNGSSHFPPGALVDYFQSIGMQFGADTNAHTSLDETVYNVFLPSASPEQLDQGLLVLADYARGALLLTDEIERERGVILAEKRARDSVSYRVHEARTRFLLHGSLAAERQPIGTEQVLLQADQALLRDFYDSWYRPDMMVLVVVGEVDPSLAEERIRARFSTLTAAVPPVPCPCLGRVDEGGCKTMVLHEPELGHTEVVVESVWNQPPQRHGFERERRRVAEMLAVSMVRHRLTRLAHQEGSPLLEVTAQSAVHLNRIGYAALSARTRAERWEEGLRLLVVTLRQALEYGFSPAELARARGELKAHLAAQVQTRHSRDSRKLAQEIIQALNDDEVFMSPEQEQAIYGPMIDGLEAQYILQTLQELWRHEGRRVQVVGTALLHPERQEAEGILAQAWHKINTAEVPPPQVQQRPLFPYLEVPAVTAAVTAREELAGIDATRYTFANGLVLNLKSTPFRQNEVMAALHFGGGRLTEPRPGMGLLAEALINESGFARLEREELLEALADRNAEMRFQTGGESFVLSGKSLRNELETLLQLMATQLRDPAFRPQAFKRVQEQLRQADARARTSAEGQMLLAGERFLAGGNTRYGMPSGEEFAAISLEAIRDWLQPVFAASSLELTLVGDMDQEETVALVGRHLGTLPAAAATAPVGRPVVFPAGGRLDLRAETALDRALVTLAFPTDDFWDIRRTRRLLVLGSLLDDLLRREIRERMGATYSPRVASIPSRIDPGFGLLRAELLVEPGRAEELLGAVRRVVAELAEAGVDEARLRQIREPILTQLKDQVRNNRYWLDSVLTLSSRHPQQLGWPLTIQADFAAIDAESISALARRYLATERAASVLVWPAGGPPEAVSPGK